MKHNRDDRENGQTSGRLRRNRQRYERRNRQGKQMQNAMTQPKMVDVTVATFLCSLPFPLFTVDYD